MEVGAVGEKSLQKRLRNMKESETPQAETLERNSDTLVGYSG
jgi:hypothetical protein